MSSRRKIIRRKKLPRWEPLTDITAACSDDFLNDLQARHGNDGSTLVRVWQSELYEVYEYDVVCPGVPGDSVTWLSIKRANKDAIHDWRHLQWIKNQICGPEREGCEIYPSESRLADTSNQYHLWVLNAGHQFPFGYTGRAVVTATAQDDKFVPGQDRQRPFEPGMEPKDALTLQQSRKIRGDL